MLHCVVGFPLHSISWQPSLLWMLMGSVLLSCREIMSNRSHESGRIDCGAYRCLLSDRETDICLSCAAGFCERQMDRGRVCKWINTVVMDTSWLAGTWECMCVCVCAIVCVTCGHVLLPGWMSSCLPAGWRRCRFDTWFQSWGQPLFPKANSPARSYLTRMTEGRD